MKIIFASDYGWGKPDTPFDKEFIENALKEPKEAMASADFRMLNLEKLFYGLGEPIVKSGPSIGMQKDMIYSLSYMGIDTVGLANNHTGDFGSENILFNLNYLCENGISYSGGGKNLDEAYLPAVFEKNGERASVITVCENEFGIADENTPGAAGYDFFRVARLIRSEKEKGGYVIVNFHGGNEDNPYPSPIKRETYRHFIEIGADAVIAMHTHCPQGFEHYLGKPIVYSMGNFFFSSSNPAARSDPDGAWYYGYMSSLELKGGEVKFEPIPYKFTNEKVEILSGKRRDNFLRHLEKISEPIKSEEKIKKLFRGWALITGPIYANHAKFTPEMRNSKELSRNIKNLFSCEAHNELITSYTNMCYHGITEEDERCKEEIMKLFTIYI